MSDPEKRGTDAGAGEGCAPYLRPYRTAVDRVGARFEALLWTSPESQRARFRAMTDMVDFRGRIVLDAGCGRADLARWLERRGIEYGRYIGVDAVPEMVEAARAQGLARAEFRQGDFVATASALMDVEAGGSGADVVVFSGSLNTLGLAEALEVLGRAWAVCREALVFNFLVRGKWGAGGKDDGPTRSHATLDVLRWALERTELVSLRQDYLDGRDATLGMWKDGGRGVAA